jgi:outer membrane lipoprotein SlyB
MNKLPTMLIPLLAITALVSGCASTEPRYSSYNQGNARSTSHRSIAVIESITRGREGNDSALLGTVVGGVVGAAVGHQVGEGRTNDVATVAGAVGGAALGRKIDKDHDRKNNDDTYAISVRFSDGSRETITQNSVGRLRVGDRVLIEDGGIRKL